MAEQDVEMLKKQGIEAYEAGKIAEARKILTKVVKTEKNDEKVWFYLAKTQTDDAKKRQCLNSVLKINPNHAEAKAELAALDAESVKAAPAAESPAAATPAKAKNGTSAGVRVPKGIPGSPDTLTVDYLKNFAQGRAKESVALYSLKSVEPAYELSWWHLVFLVGAVGFVIGLIGDLELIFNRFGVSFGALIFRPLLTILVALAAVGTGGVLSHWYVTSQRGGNAPLMTHLDKVASVWAPASILLAIVELIASLISGYVMSLYTVLVSGFSFAQGGTIILTLVAAAVSVFAMYLLVKSFQKLYAGVADSQLWITAAIAIITIGLLWFV